MPKISQVRQHPVCVTAPNRGQIGNNHSSALLLSHRNNLVTRTIEETMAITGSLTINLVDALPT